MSNLAILKELTDRLPACPTVAFSLNDYKEFVTHNGITRTWDLLWVPQLSVLKFQACKGLHYDRHYHNGREICCVAEGKMRVNFDDGSHVIVTPGREYYIPPKTHHSTDFLEDTWGVVITIPAEECYRANGQQ